MKLACLLNIFCHDDADINECDTENGGCEQFCTNQEPFFSCSCRNGFRLYNEKFCSGNKIAINALYIFC